MKKILLALVATLTILSCTRDNDTEAATENLAGRWNWKSSYSGLEGSLVTPESSGKTVILEFTNERLKYYENDQLVSEHTYTIQTRKDALGNDKKMIVYQPYRQEETYVVQDDKLVLTNQTMMDGATSEYIKVKTGE